MTLALCASACPASAQAVWGQDSGPTWGRGNAPAWGQYNSSIGSGGWRLNQKLAPASPDGAVLNPNQMGAAWGTTPNVFIPPDTRLLGRNAPPP